MEFLDLNSILDRNKIYKEIKWFLTNFFENNNNNNNNNNSENLLKKRGIFLSGPAGSGKTTFIFNLLNELNLDIIYYDASQIRNKNIIENINKNNISNVDIISLFYKKKTKYSVIIMDQIDVLNSGDKGSINALIKLIRPKKTKKQKLENICSLPIICISNTCSDKKIKELIKVTNYYEIFQPTLPQVKKIVFSLFINLSYDIQNIIINIVENNINKINIIYKIYLKNKNLLNYNFLNTFYSNNIHKENTINLTKNLITKKLNLKQYNIIISETERTILALLWHENIINILDNFNKDIGIKLYIQFLNNICYGDYLDRITFQKLIWQFNEITCLIKIFYNNYLLFKFSDHFEFTNKKYNYRFTKILTKYSNEYNNYMFIQSLSYILNLDKKDLFVFFDKNINNLNILDNIYEVNELDIKRIYKYIDNLYNYKFDVKYINYKNIDEININEIHINQIDINGIDINGTDIIETNINESNINEVI